MRLRRGYTAFGILVGALLALPMLRPVQAQHRVHVLRAAHYDAHTFVPPVMPAAGKLRVSSVTISVTYNGFSPQAQAAFAHAVAIWEQHLTSPVTVHVEASFEPLEEDVLGSAGPRLSANFSPSARSNTWYPTSMADAIAGQNVDTGESDIFATFNSDFDRWYFGLDGRPPSGQYDFVTVVLHELGHGLGFTGSFDVEDADDEDEECDSEEIGVGCWGLSTTTGRQTYPLIYDRFVEDSQETSLLDTGVYPNPSQVLGSVLQSGAVFFDGASVRTVHEDIPVDLYAPESFERGSSFSHLDEQAFPPGDDNSLMTPFLASAEAVHSPGAVTCAVLKDLGWPMGEACQALFFAGLTSAGATVVGDGAIVTFEVAPDAQIDSVIVVVGRAGEPLVRMDAVDVDAGSTEVQRFEVTIPDLAPGRYQIQLQIVDVDQIVLPGPDLSVIVPLTDRYLVGSPYPNPADEVINLTLMVRDDQVVRVEAFDALGRRMATLLSGSMNRNEQIHLSADVTDWPAGTYFIVVRGASFSSTEQFVKLH